MVYLTPDVMLRENSQLRMIHSEHTNGISSAPARRTVRQAGPRWSVEGDRLAYLSPSDCQNGVDNNNGVATVINVDGSGRRVLGNFCFSPGVSWSPDGKYVIGRASEGLALRIVRVADGMDVYMRYRDPDNFFADYYQPDWR